MAHIVALDQGTTSSRTIVFNADYQPCGIAQQEYPQLYPNPSNQTGWVEHNPEDIWQSQLATLSEALAKVNSLSLGALSITNQRETTLLWDRSTGEPLCNAIVWQDRRTAGRCLELRSSGHEDDIQQRTGLLLDAYFSATKLEWMLDNVPRARQRAQAGELAFGTVDSWLIYKLTRGAIHATDPSNASRTLLYNIKSNQWDEDLLELFNVPREVLPEVRPSNAYFGDVAIDGPARGTPILGVIGDQQAATLGQGCTQPGATKCTYGTGCFLLSNTGHSVKRSSNRLLTTVAWQSQGHASVYALEGSVFIAGAAINWLRDGLGIIQDPQDCDRLAASVSHTGGVTLVPAFAGLGAPHWDQHARGALTGITRATTAAHICRATLNAIACSVAELVDAIRADISMPISEIRVDGGVSNSDLLMQIQADLLGIPVVRPKISETTALGAACLASNALGSNTSLVGPPSNSTTRFTPTLSERDTNRIFEQWYDAVRRVKTSS